MFFMLMWGDMPLIVLWPWQVHIAGSYCNLNVQCLGQGASVAYQVHDIQHDAAH